jgi:hypothetical protein
LNARTISEAASPLPPLMARGLAGSDQQRAADAIGDSIFGPILAEFALRLWTYLGSVPQPEKAMLLFCARGGLRLRHIYEEFLARTGLTSPVSFDDLMVSRIVAARGALLERSPAAVEEILREFQGETLKSLADALAGEPVSPLLTDLHEDKLDAALSADTLFGLLFENGGGLTQFGELVQTQHRRFTDHLSAQSGQRNRIILCDTGLYGSTIRMLRHGVPNVGWTCVLFARSNYKGFDTAHFERTCGLSVERDGYSLFDRRSAALRYWQLFEDLLEPALPSVRRFDAAPGAIRSNLEIDGWRGKVSHDCQGFFRAALAYLDALPERGFAEIIYHDSDQAWRLLHRLVVWPTPDEARQLMVGQRSRDFGRLDNAAGLPAKHGGGISDRAAFIRGSLWREGAVAIEFPTLRPFILAALQSFHVLRQVRGLKR